MGKRLWIGEALRLHFDEKLTRLAVSHHLKLSDSGVRMFSWTVLTCDAELFPVRFRTNCTQ